MVRTRATWHTWLLEADQPHQHCGSNHPAPALTWQDAARTYVVLVPSMSGQMSSAGQPAVRQGVFTHMCSPGHSSASFWMMDTAAMRKSQADWKPSMQKEKVSLTRSRPTAAAPEMLWRCTRLSLPARAQPERWHQLRFSG